MRKYYDIKFRNRAYKKGSVRDGDDVAENENKRIM